MNQIRMKLQDPRPPKPEEKPEEYHRYLWLALEVYEGMTYILNKTGQQWGEILEIDETNAIAIVKTANGITNFGFYEISQWVKERLISPVCGICQEPIHGGAIRSHLDTHKVNVYG